MVCGVPAGGESSNLGEPASPRPRRPAPRRPALWALTPLVAVGVFLIAAVVAGLPPMHGGQALLAVVLTQLGPGVVIWRAVRPLEGSWFEDVVLGAAVGAAVAGPVQAVAGTTGASWLSWSAGPLLAAALLAAPRLRNRVMATRTTSLPAAWYASVSAIALALVIPTQRFYALVPLRWPAGFRTTYVDIPYHLALAGQLAHRGPTGMPHVLGEPLRYHWFSHAWVAQVSEAGQVPLDAVLTRFMPALFAALVVFGIAAAAVRVSNRVWAGPIAAGIAVLGGEHDLVLGPRTSLLIAPLSPSLAFSVVTTVALIALLAARWRGLSRRGAVPVIVLLAAVAAGGKGSAGLVLVAGVLCAAAAARLMKAPGRRTVVIDAALVVLSFVAVYAAVFTGRGNGLALDPVESLSSSSPVGRALLAGAPAGMAAVAVVAVARVISLGARALGFLGVVGDPQLRRDPAFALVGGIALAGVGGVLLLSHPGRSQLYFLANSVPAVAIGAAGGLVVLWERARDQWRLVAAAAVVAAVAVDLLWLAFGDADSPVAPAAALGRALAVVVIFAATALGAAAAARRFRRPAGAVAIAVLATSVLLAGVGPVLANHVQLPQPAAADVSETTPLAFSGDQIDAARWLRDHSRRDDVVATNRHCVTVTERKCDARRFFVAAYTERRVLVEGWAYTPTWSFTVRLRDTVFWDPPLLALNDTFMTAPSAQGALALRARGVDWVFIDKTGPHSTEMEDFADLRHETPWAAVYELRDP